MSKLIYIYGLLDPDTCEIKYIGKTSNTLNNRLSCHLNLAKKRGHKNILYAWIKSILNKEKRPIIKELHLSNELDQNDDEKFYIEYFKYIGANLKNQQPGGDGQPIGYKFKNRYVPPKGETPEHFKAHHRSRLGRKNSEEMKRKRKETIAKNGGDPRSISLIVDNGIESIIFKSTNECARYFNLDRRKLYNIIENSKQYQGFKIRKLND